MIDTAGHKLDEIKRCIDAVKAGNTDAFGHIYDHYLKLVVSLLHRVGLCPADELEDHLNEIFMRIFRGIFEFRKESEFSTFVYSIVRNYSREVFRKNKKRPLLHQDMSSIAGNIGFENRIINSIMLQEALAQLTLKLRVIIVLYYYEGYSIKEIAAMESLRIDTVKNRLKRGRDTLKKILSGGMNEC